jgi:hypothetical protein
MSGFNYYDCIEVTLPTEPFDELELERSVDAWIHVPPVRILRKGGHIYYYLTGKQPHSLLGIGQGQIHL